mmetsp:Transcript_8025/g.33773  ORF Transcript_8025/g.33773 Transcript_8025/m.33773 type:complete len:327 (+) Transcript_8025:164-1144(+)
MPMEGVEIAISGIPNPERAEIRKKVLEMGGRYNANWSRSTTHLICPSPNPSKFAQALKDKKPIMLPSWVHDCHAQLKLLPLADYELVPGQTAGLGGGAGKKRTASVALPQSRPGLKKKKTVDYSYGGWLDSDSEKAVDAPDAADEVGDDSAGGWGLDVKMGSAVPAATQTQQEQEDEEFVADDAAEPDEEEFYGDERGEDGDGDELMAEAEPPAAAKASHLLARPANVPERALPSFLAHCFVHLHGIEDEELQRRLRRIVVAYGGALDTFLYTNTTHVVTEADWQPRFTMIQDRQPDTCFAGPEWLLACDRSQALVDTSDYLIAED